MEKRDWIIELNEELKKKAEVSQDEPESWQKRSIYRVPAHTLNQKKEAYVPWLVALGPYHHNDEHLKPMEVHKHRALRHFLHRSEKPLECYVDALAEVVQDLMDAYDQLDVAWKQDAKAFLQLMIVDGCFILETMYVATQPRTDYPPSDPIFSSAHGKQNAVPYLARDMLLLENQVPLLVLHRLHAVETGNYEQSESEVTQLILKLYDPDEKVSRMGQSHRLHILDVRRESLIFKVGKNKPNKCQRMLDKFRRYLLPTDKTKHKTEPDIGEEAFKYSATQLQEAGIDFQKSDIKRPKYISFSGRSLRLPVIHLDDVSESTFLNIIAFERYHVGAGNGITSYIFFMNRLIRDVGDVLLLTECGIISNNMGCDEEVAKLFLTLSKDIIHDSNGNDWLNDVYREVGANLRGHIKNMLIKWRYKLYHTYLTSPWAIVSIVAATLGFGLTITETLYSILSFIHRRP